ncbi:tetratricopeptide repeat protein [Flavobacterium sp. NRK F10]|uniref:tetratricopeptide repeat protein n=1 Tax=Flavobacterium sp. NRK F10 TaxID=2954931 RepID=UPI002091909C|nr:tetratricopeptide repeat protein [Flavobacterium sp. NRK F10]MCO6176156.1 tetratricopeptide repeat protein [Flavobacterium sp. NRK F10]
MRYNFLLFSLLLIICCSPTVNAQNLKQLKEELEQAIQHNSTPVVLEKRFLIGKIYAESGLYANALEYFNSVLKDYQNNSKDSLFVKTNIEVGELYNNTKRYANAIPFIEQAISVSKQLDYKQGLVKAYSTLGSSYEKQGNYMKALEFENKSLSALSEKGHREIRAKVYENIGSIYEDLMQYDEAFEYFEKSYQLVKGTSSKAEANVLNNIGDVYRKKGNLTIAITITRQALEVATKVNDNHLLESATKDLAKAYALQGDYEKAYNYRLEAENFKELSLKAENQNQVNVLLTDLKINQKESQIKLLKEQNKLNSTRLILSVVILGIFFISVFLWFLYAGKRRRINTKLQELEQEKLKAELELKAKEKKNLHRNLEVKNTALSRYSLHLVQKNKLLTELSAKLKHLTQRQSVNYEKHLKDLCSEIDFTLQQDSEWNDFNVFFEEIHPNFTKNLSEAAIETLTPTELKLGILLRLNLSSKEIASILRVTPDSVRVARHRFRKKLPLDTKEDLVAFLLAL